jgi:N-acetylglucosaminyldiphosphoundecaprenol N-acetyl-beta-D-mannosaminyltransferase
MRISILGIPIDNITPAEATTRVARFLQAGTPHHIVTINPEFVMEAQHNATFREVLLHADLATPDGFGLVLAAWWQGTPLRERVTGVELTHRIAALAAAQGYRLFLLGAAPGVAEAAAAVLVQRYPGLTIAGCYAGAPHPRYEPFLRQIIAAAHPDVLLVAYGHPQQDLWIARNQPHLGIPVAMGVGGVFDYIAGRVPFAPAWLRRLGLEWLYRLVCQPRRWRRIVVAVPLFLWAVLRAKRPTAP